MTVINLTPHPIDVVTERGTLRIPASGMVARINTTEEPYGQVVVDGVPIKVVRSWFGEIVFVNRNTKNPVQFVPKTCNQYIVSLATLIRMRESKYPFADQFIAPDMTNLVVKSGGNNKPTQFVTM